MVQAGIELCETDFDKLIMHLEMLEETAREHKDYDGNQEGKKIPKPK